MSGKEGKERNEEREEEEQKKKKPAGTRTKVESDLLKSALGIPLASTNALGGKSSSSCNNHPIITLQRSKREGRAHLDPHIRVRVENIVRRAHPEQRRQETISTEKKSGKK
jgi:hypothetical protein